MRVRLGFYTVPLKDSITVPVRGLGFDVWDLGLT